MLVTKQDALVKKRKAAQDAEASKARRLEALLRAQPGATLSRLLTSPRWLSSFGRYRPLPTTTRSAQPDKSPVLSCYAAQQRQRR